MRIEIDKEEYKDLIETKVEFLKTVRKLDNITIENIKLTDKLQEKEQEVQQAMDNYVQLDLQRVKEYNELVDLYKAKEQEYNELMEKIRKWQQIEKN